MHPAKIALNSGTSNLPISDLGVIQQLAKSNQTLPPKSEILQNRWDQLALQGLGITTPPKKTNIRQYMKNHPFWKGESIYMFKLLVFFSAFWKPGVKNSRRRHVTRLCRWCSRRWQLRWWRFHRRGTSTNLRLFTTWLCLPVVSLWHLTPQTLNAWFIDIRYLCRFGYSLRGKCVGKSFIITLSGAGISMSIIQVYIYILIYIGYEIQTSRMANDLPKKIWYELIFSGMKNNPRVCLIRMVNVATYTMHGSYYM